MDYGKSFTYVFEDDNWISKFLVGVVVSLVPIVNLAGYGYMVELLKNVRDGVENPLPDWDDFGKFFVDGLKYLAGLLVYLIPVILLSFAIIPIAIAADAVGTPDEALGGVLFLFYCGIFILTFLPMLFYPALFVQFAKNDEIMDMLRIGDIWQLVKEDLGNYIIILLMVFFVLSFIVSLGMIACFIGIFFTAWWGQLASAHMFGQFAKPKEKPAESAAF